MMALANPLAAMVSLLRADSDVLAAAESRIYAARVGDVANMPQRCVEVYRNGGPPVVNYDRIARVYFEMRCYGKGEGVAGSIDSADLDLVVYGYLRDFAQETHAGCRVSTITMIDGPEDAYTPEQWPYVRRLYEMEYQERKVA